LDQLVFLKSCKDRFWEMLEQYFCSNLAMVSCIFGSYMTAANIYNIFYYILLPFSVCFFTARCYASAVYAVIVCLSVRLSSSREFYKDG